jgi:hypothetical protein
MQDPHVGASIALVATGFHECQTAGLAAMIRGNHSKEFEYLLIQSRAHATSTRPRLNERASYIDSSARKERR